MSSSGSDEETPSKGIKRKVARSSRKSAIEMLLEKYKEKAKLKEKELEVRKMELDLQKQKYEMKLKKGSFCSSCFENN